MARSAEEKLRDAFVPMDDKNMRKFRRLLSAYRREELKAASDRAVTALEETGSWQAVVAAIMGGRHGSR